jgi:hypothetical protein
MKTRETLDSLNSLHTDIGTSILHHKTSADKYIAALNFMASLLKYDWIEFKKVKGKICPCT